MSLCWVPSLSGWSGPLAPQPTAPSSQTPGKPDTMSPENCLDVSGPFGFWELIPGTWVVLGLGSTMGPGAGVTSTAPGSSAGAREGGVQSQLLCLGGGNLLSWSREAAWPRVTHHTLGTPCRSRSQFCPHLPAAQPGLLPLGLLFCEMGTVTGSPCMAVGTEWM